MNFKKNLFTSMLILVAITSFAQKLKSVYGEGDLVIVKTELSEFKDLAVNIDCEIVLHQSNERKAVVTAQQNIIDNLKFKYNESSLTISSVKNLKKHKKITIHLYNPEFTGLTLAGSARIISTEGLNTEAMDVSIAGSGRISIAKLNTNKLSVAISGSGKLIVEGGTQLGNLDILISGSGSFKGENIEAENADIRISGSGSARVNVSKSLDAAVSGSGDIYYKGEAAVDVSASGSGKIKKI